MSDNIIEIGKENLQAVHDIAKVTWPVAYGEILKQAQLEYMLDRFYSVESLSNSMDAGHLFYVCYERNIPIGFLSLQFMEDGISMKIHKLYVLPSQQGKGIGVKLFRRAESEMQEKGFKRLFLNVNRFNQALDFYKRMDMKIQMEENIDIGQGYWMEDYVMEKRIE